MGSAPSPPERVPSVARRQRRRWLTLLALPAVALLVAEFAVRAFDLGPAPRPVFEGSVVRPVDDPDWGYVPIPSSERVVLYPAFGG